MKRIFIRWSKYNDGKRNWFIRWIIWVFNHQKIIVQMKVL